LGKLFTPMCLCHQVIPAKGWWCLWLGR